MLDRCHQEEPKHNNKQQLISKFPKKAGKVVIEQETHKQYPDASISIMVQDRLNQWQ
jgi:hypothetical protein